MPLSMFSLTQQVKAQPQQCVCVSVRSLSGVPFLFSFVAEQCLVAPLSTVRTLLAAAASSAILLSH